MQGLARKAISTLRPTYIFGILMLSIIAGCRGGESGGQENFTKFLRYAAAMAEESSTAGNRRSPAKAQERQQHPLSMKHAAGILFLQLQPAQHLSLQSLAAIKKKLLSARPMRARAALPKAQHMASPQEQAPCMLLALA